MRVDKCELLYGPVYENFLEDQRFYDLEFKEDLNLPEQFADDAIVLPTARDVVDAVIDHTDIANARIYVNKKGTSGNAPEDAEMLRKFGLGLIHRTNVEADIAPGRVSAKHFWIHGLTILKSVWDVDSWIARPMQGEGEPDENFNKKLDTWREEKSPQLPIIIKAVHPGNMMLDPYYGGRMYVIERHKKLVFDAKKMRFGWNNPKGLKEDETVDYIEYWDKDYRCVLIDREPVLKVPGGVYEHSYGFIPYTVIESGLGNVSIDALPEIRYVGLIRHMKPLLISESLNYSMCNILIKRETMKGGYITGADAASVGEIKQEYGTYWPIGEKDVEIHDWESKMPPDKAYGHLSLTHEYIATHTAPRSMMGQSESGVRSGADRRLVLSEAQSKLNYSKQALANGWAQLLGKCAQLVKDVIPGDFELWARSPTDEFDLVIKKAQFKEPFNFYVEFSPISPEDEYRRHEDLIRLNQAGLVDKHWSRTRMSDVDPIAMQRRETKEMIRLSPAYRQMVDQHVAAAAHQALEAAGLPMIPPAGQEGQPQGGGGQEGPGRSLVPGVPNRAEPGSAGEMLNSLQAEYGRPRQNVYQGAAHRRNGCCAGVPSRRVNASY